MSLDKDSLRKLALASVSVTEVVICSLCGFAAGYYLDHWIKITAPWLTVIFTFVGMVGGFYRLYKVFARDEEETNKRNGSA